jgi:hypothetical protein
MDEFLRAANPFAPVAPPPTAASLSPAPPPTAALARAAPPTTATVTAIGRLLQKSVGTTSKFAKLLEERAQIATRGASSSSGACLGQEGGANFDRRTAKSQSLYDMVPPEPPPDKRPRVAANPAEPAAAPMMPPWRRQKEEQEMREQLFQQQQQLYQQQQAQMLQEEQEEREQLFQQQQQFYQQQHLEDHDLTVERQASLGQLLQRHRAQLQEFMGAPQSQMQPTTQQEELQQQPLRQPLPMPKPQVIPPPSTRPPLPKNQNDDGSRRNRPRGGGFKAKWITAFNRLSEDGASPEQIVKMLGACPSSSTAVSKAKVMSPFTWWSATTNSPQELFDDEQGGS